MQQFDCEGDPVSVMIYCIINPNTNITQIFFIKIQGDCDKFRSVPLVQQFDSDGDPVSVTALQSVQQI